MMGSGEYSENLIVRHADGAIYAYYVYANPVGDNAVLLQKRLIHEGCENNVIELMGYDPTGTEFKGRNLEKSDVKPAGPRATKKQVAAVREKLAAQGLSFPTRDEIVDSGRYPTADLFRNMLLQKSVRAGNGCKAPASGPMPKVPSSGHGRDDGLYTDPMYVLHESGLVFRYYVHANPGRDGAVLMERQLMANGRPSDLVEVCTMDVCGRGVHIDESDAITTDTARGSSGGEFAVYGKRLKAKKAFPNHRLEPVNWSVTPSEFAGAMLGGGYKAPAYTGEPEWMPGTREWWK